MKAGARLASRLACKRIEVHWPWPCRSAGQKQEFEGETYTVEELTEKRYVHVEMLLSAIDQPSLFNTCLLISIEGAARQRS